MVSTRSLSGASKSRFRARSDEVRGGYIFGPVVREMRQIRTAASDFQG